MKPGTKRGVEFIGDEASSGWKKLIGAGLLKQKPTDVDQESVVMYWSGDLFRVGGKRLNVTIWKEKEIWWLETREAHFKIPDQEKIEKFWQKQLQRIHKEQVKDVSWL